MRTKTHAMSLVLALILCLASSAISFAEEDPVGTAAMMGIGMGARALGMGGAGIAIADDASTIYYNPAGLGLIQGRAVTSLYTNHHGAAGYLAAGYAQKNMGAGILRLDASGIDKTDEFADVIGTFGATELTAMAGYGRAVIPGLSVGGSVKYYSQTLPANSGSGVTGDIGVLYEVGSGNFRVGAVARNVVGTVKYDEGASDAFERSYGIGAAFRPMEPLLIAADVVIEDGVEARAGAEYSFGSITVRAGGSFGAGSSSLSAGAGFAASVFTVDYAYQTHSVLPDSHRFSLNLKF